MPESVSTVDAILDGLRDRATGWSCVPLADAVAAVHAAADTARGETWDAAQAEIKAAVDARTQEIRALLMDAAEAEDGNGWHSSAADLRDAAHNIARRFPNGGTHDA